MYKILNEFGLKQITLSKILIEIHRSDNYIKSEPTWPKWQEEKFTWEKMIHDVEGAEDKLCWRILFSRTSFRVWHCSGSTWIDKRTFRRCSSLFVVVVLLLQADDAELFLKLKMEQFSNCCFFSPQGNHYGSRPNLLLSCSCFVFHFHWRTNRKV